MDIKNKKNLVFILFLILNFVPQFFVIISQPDNLMNWYKTDDAFYYFKTAQNIAEGNGITFDGIAPTNGFHPLWMVICVPVFALARYDLFLPLRVLAAVQILLNAASGYLLYELFSEKISKTIAWITAIFWMFFPQIHELTTKLGLETGLNAFMLIAFVYTLSRLSRKGSSESRPHEFFVAGLCGAGLLLSRLDNIFLLLMVGLWLVFRGKEISQLSQIDFLLILFSTITSFFIRLSSNTSIFDYVSFLYILAGLSLTIKPTLLYLCNCYVSQDEESVFMLLIKRIFVVTLSNGLVFIILVVLQDYLHLLIGFPRSAVLIDWALSTVLIGGHHLIQRYRGVLKQTDEEDISLKINWHIWAGRALEYFSPIVVILIIYMVVNDFYAGTAMPVSGQIKRWWGTLPHTIYGRPITTLSGMVKGLFDPGYETGPFWLLTQPLDRTANALRSLLRFTQLDKMFAQILNVVIVWTAFFSVVYLLAVRQIGRFNTYAQRLALLPLFTGTIFHAVSYKSTGYLHVREWYWMGGILLILLFLSILLAILLEIFERKPWGRTLTAAFVVLICGTLWGLFSVSVIQKFPLDGQVPYDYDIDGEVQFIRMHTDPGDVIGMTGGGLTAYFVPDRTIINLDGLINSADYFDKLRNGNTTEYLIENDVKYVYGDELVLLDSDPYRWIFRDTLTHLEKGPFFYLYTYHPRELP